jgi:ubiquinone/menaquinone biosynthesis C-methylase UbiE
MDEIKHLPKLYRELSDWWPILSAPEDYAEEAAFYQEVIVSISSYPPKTMLELGSGGGNNASFLKNHFQMTLVDLSPGMIEVSRNLNPECEHIQGDMRTLRLDRQFDAVFIHDAIVYMTSEVDLRKAIDTAYLHCKPGGVALFAPDDTRETFQPTTDHGGHDGAGRSLRYIEWMWDPDPMDTSYISYMVYLLREGANDVRCVIDEHECGLFSQDEWLQWIADAGFQPHSVPFEHSEVEAGSVFVFTGLKQ